MSNIGGLIFFGLCLLIGIIQFFDRRPAVIINEIGIEDRRISKKLFNWDIINDAYLTSINNSWFLCLVIDETADEQSGNPKRGKLFNELNEAFGFQRYNISLGQLNIKKERLLELVLQLRQYPAAERLKVLEQLPAKL